MAGHSKFKNIMHRKGAQDAKRGKIFQKLSKEIFVAAKNGGPDPETNANLRLAIDKAKAKSLPKDRIEGAIKRVTGSKEKDNYEEIVYEGYGPHGVAILVHCLTDNKNRTASSVRSIFNKRGGNLGADGSVSYLFKREGILIVAKDKLKIDSEEFQLNILDFNIDQLEEEEEFIIIKITPDNFSQVKEKLDQADLIEQYETAEITLSPTMEVSLEEEAKEKVINLIEQLEEDDDVQEVYTNLE